LVLNKTSIFHLHDRSDDVIPEAGGFAGGWEYESADSVLEEWAKVHGCEEETTVKKTSYDGGKYNIACVEHAKCASKKSVVKCLYDGHHGSWPDRGELLLSLLNL
jgi:poly(3-hydroxybutyrate) depolymerase